jgi:hypothetical protein
MDFLAPRPANRAVQHDAAAICSVADQEIEVQARVLIHATPDVTAGPHGFSSAISLGISGRLDPRTATRLDARQLPFGVGERLF